MDDIDFSIQLHKHGWTTFAFWQKSKCYDITISSVLSSPVYDFTNMLLSLLNKENNIAISWFLEPGWSIFKISRNMKMQHLIRIEIGESIDQEGNGYEKMLEFEIKQKQFIIVGFFQLKKIFNLLQDTHFLKNRENNFPFEAYQKLSARISELIPEIM